MASTVREIMNPELLSVRSDAPADETLDMILTFGVTAVPVLDDEGRPIGVTSLRDLVRMGAAHAPMTSPATTVALGASITSVAETMATTGRHHLVVVGADGLAVGMVSTLDVIRALLGYPAAHPVEFPGHDAELGSSWSSDVVLDKKGASTIPPQPGVLVLVHGGVDQVERAVWAEETDNLRRLTDELLVRPCQRAELENLLHHDAVRMRYSVLPEASSRHTVARRLRDRIAFAPPPGGT